MADDILKSNEEKLADILKGSPNFAQTQAELQAKAAENAANQPGLLESLVSGGKDLANKASEAWNTRGEGVGNAPDYLPAPIKDLTNLAVHGDVRGAAPKETQEQWEKRLAKSEDVSNFMSEDDYASEISVVDSSKESALDRANRKLLENTTQHQEELKKLTDEQSSILGQQIAIEGKKAQIIQDQAKIKEELLGEFDERYNNRIKEIETERDNLTKLDSKSFWDNPKTPERILMGLGMLAALSGKNDNLAAGAMMASKVIGKAVSEDMAAQEKKVLQRLNMLDKQENLNQQERTYAKNKLTAQLDARKLAALDQQEKLMNQTLLLTKNTEAKQALQNEMKKTNEQKIMLQAEIDKKAQQDVSYDMSLAENQPTSEELDQKARQAYEFIAPTDKDGNPLPMTEGQGKMRVALASAAPALKDLESLEKGLTTNEYKALQDGMGQVLQRLRVRDIGLIGSGVDAVANTLQGFVPEILENAVPGKGAQYAQALMQYMRVNLRLDTGAQISPGEIIGDLERYGVSPGTDHKAMKGKITDRRERLKAFNDAIGGKGKLFWQATVDKGNRK